MSRPDPLADRTPADGLRPRSLRRTARTLRRIAEHVLEAGHLWTGVLRAGLAHAMRTRHRNPCLENVDKATAWKMARDFGAKAGNPEDAADVFRHMAAQLDEIADDVEHGRINVAETTDAQGNHVLAIETRR